MADCGVRFDDKGQSLNFAKGFTYLYLRTKTIFGKIMKVFSDRQQVDKTE
jgi:hypothetical protein